MFTPIIRIMVRENFVQTIVRESATPYCYIEKGTGDPRAPLRLIDGEPWAHVLQTGQELTNKDIALETLAGVITLTLHFDGDKFNVIDARHISPTGGGKTLVPAFQSALGDKILRNLLTCVAERSVEKIEKIIVALRTY